MRSDLRKRKASVRLLRATGLQLKKLSAYTTTKKSNGQLMKVRIQLNKSKHP